MTHHGKEEEHQESLSGPVVHGGEGDPLGGGVEEAAPDSDDGANDDAPGRTGNPDDDQPPLPDDEPKPGL